MDLVKSADVPSRTGGIIKTQAAFQRLVREGVLTAPVVARIGSRIFLNIEEFRRSMAEGGFPAPNRADD